ncbi:SDR family oxidoreductase [Burkholderia multivorans]|nr:SDR family oxidoreductase [Burkholderia multivorans]
MEWGQSAVCVNAISPGVINTDFARPVTGNAGMLERRIAATPLRCGAQPGLVFHEIWQTSSMPAPIDSGPDAVPDKLKLCRRGTAR